MGYLWCRDPICNAITTDSGAQLPCPLDHLSSPETAFLGRRSLLSLLGFLSSLGGYVFRDVVSIELLRSSLFLFVRCCSSLSIVGIRSLSFVLIVRTTYSFVIFRSLVFVRLLSFVLGERLSFL